MSGLPSWGCFMVHDSNSISSHCDHCPASKKEEMKLNEDEGEVSHFFQGRFHLDSFVNRPYLATIFFFSNEFSILTVDL